MSAEPLSDRGRRTREGLLTAARSTFEAKGFDATRMSDVAAAAGVSHGTVYTWFANKDDLLRALVADLVDGVYASLTTHDTGGDEVERLVEANERYLRAYARDARMLAIVEQAGRVDPYCAEAIAGLRRAHVQRVTHVVHGLQRNGRAKGVDAHVAAAALCVMVEGYARHHLDPDLPVPQAALDTLSTLWARGLGLPDPGPRRARRRR